jgi:hypothetical protein
MTHEVTASVVKDYNAFTAAINATKSSTNPHFKNKFAPLDSWLSEIHKHAAANNFMVTESMLPTRGNDDQLYQSHTCELTHVSGWSLTSTYIVCSVDEKPQAMGAATTYARRYNLQVLLNCTGEDDDDGTQAQATITADRTPVAMKRRVA